MRAVKNNLFGFDSINDNELIDMGPINYMLSNSVAMSTHGPRGDMGCTIGVFSMNILSGGE